MVACQLEKARARTPDASLDLVSMNLVEHVGIFQEESVILEPQHVSWRIDFLKSASLRRRLRRNITIFPVARHQPQSLRLQ